MTARADKVFWGYFLFSFLAFLVYLAARGFGWDGDSLANAAQFVKLFNRDIFGALDAGNTLPKLMAVFTFGIFYKIFNNFYALTFFSILLNSWMFALVCKWVGDNGGNRFITLIALIANTMLLFSVIICDNAAFSLPFVFFGLYLYFHKGMKRVGALLILIAGLFRPGPEIIILFLILLELWKKNNRLSLLLSIYFLAGAAHSLFSFKLAYLDYGDFYAHGVLPLNPDIGIRYSPAAFIPYLKSIWVQVTRPTAVVFFILSLFGFARMMRKTNDIKFASLAIFASYLCPVAIFRYGGIGVYANYHLEFAVFYAIFVAFFAYENSTLRGISARIRYKAVLKAVLIILLFGFIIYKGIKQRGEYEVRPDGNGSLRWKSVSDLRQLFPEGGKLRAAVTREDSVFFVLDLGYRLKKLQILRDPRDLRQMPCGDYDIIMLRRGSENNCDDDRSFRKIYPDDSRVILIRGQSPAKE